MSTTSQKTNTLTVSFTRRVTKSIDEATPRELATWASERPGDADALEVAMDGLTNKRDELAAKAQPNNNTKQRLAEAEVYIALVGALLSLNTQRVTFNFEKDDDAS
ncbi:MAG: hypothetical protein F4Y47_09855 [Acidobacteriia bacterium]|nr:hypothetical protein [Terriglobia bacterium]MYG02777.1 hypothetical protein [Terriglobia bacterium]MYK11753.1 hypothetical protein [Terriglobia bacterium]